MPAPPTKLQITAPPPAGGNASGSSKPPNRQPFRPSNGNYQNRFQPRQQRVYQAAVEEGYDENEPEQDYDNSQNAYTSHALYQSEAPAEAFDSHEEHDYSHDDDPVEGYFTKTMPVKDYQCEHCQLKVISRNKLFTHLREECWRKPSASTPVTGKDLVADTLASDAGKPFTEPVIVPSVSEPIPGTGFAFRNYHYAVTHISWKPAGKKKETCADAGCTITMADRTFIPATAEVKKMAAKIPIRGLESKIHHSDEYAVHTFYMKGVLPDNTRAFAQITREIHIVDDLKAGMLIGADILTPERMTIDFATQSIKIGSCRDIVVPMDSRARSEPVKRTVKSLSKTILPPRTTMPISVTYAGGKLPDDRDLLFEPQCALPLGLAGGVYAHMVDASFHAVQVRNDTDQAIVIPRKARLGMLGEYEQDGCFPVGAHHANLAATG